MKSGRNWPLLGQTSSYYEMLEALYDAGKNRKQFKSTDSLSSLVKSALNNRERSLRLARWEKL